MINAMPAALLPGTPKLPDKIVKAATDFTAVALGELLKPLFDTVDTSTGMFGGGAGEQAWRPMMVDELAKAIAQDGGLGLRTQVAQAMLQAQALLQAQTMPQAQAMSASAVSSSAVSASAVSASAGSAKSISTKAGSAWAGSQPQEPTS